MSDTDLRKVINAALPRSVRRVKAPSEKHRYPPLFFTPEQWAAKGHEVTPNLVGVVWFEGSEVAEFFDYDAAAARSGPNCYARLEKMVEALEAVEVYSEVYYGTAPIYRIPE